MQLCDVRMIETGEHADFADKPHGQIRFGDQIGKKHLHRLGAVRNHVANPVDASHAAYAQHADDLVVANPLTYLESHKVTSGLSPQTMVQIECLSYQQDPLRSA